MRKKFVIAIITWMCALAGISLLSFETSGVTATLDPSFGDELGLRSHGIVNGVARQSSGKIVLAGEFEFISGKFSPRIARLNADGAMDASFNPGMGTMTSSDGAIFGVTTDSSDRISTMNLETNGLLVVGGSFVSVEGVQRPSLARINPDGPSVPAQISITIAPQQKLLLKPEVESGVNYIIESSKDLVNWSSWTNFTANTSQQVFELNDLVSSAEFFRIRTEPASPSTPTSPRKPLPE